MFLCDFEANSLCFLYGMSCSCSRSQCIINIRGASAMCDDVEVGFVQNDAVLTIVDLAGAERERRTGIQVLINNDKQEFVFLSHLFISYFLLNCNFLFLYEV